MAICQTILVKIVSIDRTHNVIFNNEYIIKLLSNLKLVRAYLDEHWQSSSILWCLFLILTHSRRALFRVFNIGIGQTEDILGINLVKEFLIKSN